LIKASWRTWALLAPGIIVVTVLLVLPLCATAYLSLSSNPIVQFEGVKFANFAYLLEHQYYLSAIWRTIRLSLAATAITLVIGYAVALSLHALVRGHASVLILGLTYPVLAGPLIVVLGWMILLSDGGPLLRSFVQAGILPPLRLVGTETAVMIGMTHFMLPFVILILYAAVRTIPDDLIEAARGLGANSRQILWQVMLPLSLPGLTSATIIGFSIAASAYITPHYLGGVTKLVLTTMVGQFILGTFNTQLAAAAAMLLLALMTVVVFGASYAGSRLTK
jgi:ABC-type spermidine/putrescine transport system permease subunit I